MANSIMVSRAQLLAGPAGRELATSDWFALTQEHIARFAEATEDRQWIHTDARRAEKESPFGAAVAHGFLTLSLLSHLMEHAIRVRDARLAINYGLNRVRFPAPVRAGSRVRARFTLQSSREAGGAVEAVWGVVVEIEGGEKPGCVAEWIVRYYA